MFTAHPDLFEDQASLPAKIRALISAFNDARDQGEADPYQACVSLSNRLRSYGYAFDYGLDGVPYGLTKLPDGSCSGITLPNSFVNTLIVGLRCLQFQQDSDPSLVMLEAKTGLDVNGVLSGEELENTIQAINLGDYVTCNEIVDAWRTGPDNEEIVLPVVVPGATAAKGAMKITEYMDDVMERWKAEGYTDCGYTAS